MIDRCGKDSLIISLSRSCKSKNPSIVELSFKALERVLQLQGQNIAGLQPVTFKEVFLAIVDALNGKRAEALHSAERMTKGMFTALGQQNFTYLVNLLYTNAILTNDDVVKLQRVFEEKETKSKDVFREQIREQRTRRLEAQT